MWARQRGRRCEPHWQFPAVSCNDRANVAQTQKVRRPEGFRAKCRLASLFLSRRPTRGILLRHASPSSLLPKNSATRNFESGSPSDSQYVVKAMMEGWVTAWKRKGWWRTKTERPENVDLWQRLDALCQTHQVEFRWVKGHAGNLENERCDQLAMAALRQPNLLVDDGYENKPETDGVRPDMQEGEPCYKCSTPVIKRKGKWKPGQESYFEFHLWCPKCEIAYHVESAKRFVEQPKSLF